MKKLSKRVPALLAVALAATVLAAIPIAAPSAGAVESGVVPGNVAPSYQTNGTVRAIASANGVVYLGGDFTAVRPPGAAAGTNETARSRFVALNASTGAPTGFNPNFNGAVHSVALSPDKSTLYVGGDFTTVNGTGRNRIAAFNLSTSALTSFNPNVNGRVRGIAVTPDTVFVGGSFGQVGGQNRRQLASLTLGGTVRAGFIANAQNVVYSIAVSKQFDKLYVAGAFNDINGNTNAYRGGVVDAASGNVLPFPAGGPDVITPESGGCTTSMKDVKTTDDTVYFAAEGTGGGCMDGAFAVNVADDSLKWATRCLGATQSIEEVGSNVYLGAHTHDCVNDQWFDPGAFDEVGWSRGISRHLTSRNAETGVLTSWTPNTNGGPGGGLGPRTMGTDGTQLFVGGEFTTVNGQNQQGFARFSPSVSTSAPATPARPLAVPLPGGKVGVYVQPPLDLDDSNLKVRIYRSGTTTPIAEITAESLFWRRPVVSFIDDSLSNGASATYTADAVDNSGLVSPRSPASRSVTTGATTAYSDAVNADSPSFYWRLGEAAGSVNAADSSLSGKGGVFQAYGATPTFGQAGAVGDANTAVEFDGATEFLTTDKVISGPSTYSAEAWVRTTTTSGGKILGFGNQQGGIDFGGNPQLSGSYDRQIYMLNDGRIRFGVWVGFADTLTSQTSYNDGQYHHIVATQGPSGMQLFVDGVRVGRNGQSANQAYDGFWRIGGDNLGGWPDQPASPFFNGTIDETAVYPTALTTTQVQAHYAASGRTPPAPVIPADDYGKAVFNDSPVSYWRFDEADDATTAADASDNGSTGNYVGDPELGEAGALGATGTAVTLDGGDDNVASTSPAGGPSQYAMEFWFNTTTGNGGKLVGYGNSQTGNSGNYDKHVYMTNDGRLLFGVYNGGFDIVSTPTGGYNDGEWHQVVAQQGPSGMQLFVDDNLVGANGQTNNQGYAGFWRVGGDNLGAWPDRPNTDSFAGSIDEVAIYATPISAAQVHDHFLKSGRTGPDLTDPSTSITSPANGATVPAGTVTVTADAADNVGVDHVELFVDGVSAGTDSAAPYSFDWTAVAGAHTLHTVAVDAAANSGESASVTVNVTPPDTAAPTTAITSPAEGTNVYGPVTVTADAADDHGVAEVEFFLDGTVAGSDSSAPYTFDWNAVAEGAHTLQAVATDTSGNTGGSTIVSVTVPADSTAPTAPGTPVASNVTKSAATLTWTAATDDRGVAGYQIVRDGLVLPGTVTGLTFTDTGLTANTGYSYTVRAVDNADNVGTDSGAVVVTTLPPITNLFTDLFDGPNGSAWKTAWTSSAVNGTIDLQGNAGRLAPNDVAGAYARTQLTSVPVSADTETTFSYQWSATGPVSYFSVFTRGSGGWGNSYRPRNGYGLQFVSNSGAVSVQKNVDNVNTTVRSVAGAQQVSTGKQWVKLRVAGSQIQFKTWVDGAIEPTAWRSTDTDTAVTAPGQLFLAVNRGGANVGAKGVTIDDLTVIEAN